MNSDNRSKTLKSARDYERKTGVSLDDFCNNPLKEYRKKDGTPSMVGLKAYIEHVRSLPSRSVEQKMDIQPEVRNDPISEPMPPIQPQISPKPITGIPEVTPIRSIEEPNIDEKKHDDKPGDYFYLPDVPEPVTVDETKSEVSDDTDRKQLIGTIQRYYADKDTRCRYESLIYDMKVLSKMRDDQLRDLLTAIRSTLMAPTAGIFIDPRTILRYGSLIAEKVAMKFGVDLTGYSDNVSKNQDIIATMHILLNEYPLPFDEFIKTPGRRLAFHAGVTLLMTWAANRMAIKEELEKKRVPDGLAEEYDDL
jgi:hypothetical protein